MEGGRTILSERVAREGSERGDRNAAVLLGITAAIGAWCGLAARRRRVRHLAGLPSA